MKLIDTLTRAANDLITLDGDIARILDNETNKDKITNGEKEARNMKSLQEITVLRKNKEELIKAQENPETTFIRDQINKIFRF